MDFSQLTTSMDAIVYYTILFIVALVSTWWIFKKVLKIAILKNIVDNPDARKIQKTPVPVLGGIAVFFGIIVSLVFTGLFYETSSLFAIMGLMAIMVYVGTMDDILSLSPYMRFIIEIIVILLLVFCNHYSLNNFHGLWGIYNIPEWIAVPLTVFVCVGIINAINLIDGVNGLCSGFCILACVVFAGIFIWADDKEAASVAVLSIGALIPFFCHNVFGKKSKMFLGDSGSLLMGTIISTFIIGALNNNSPLAEKVNLNFGLIPFTISVLAIPIFDTLRVMTRRIMRGHSPFSPDRTHLHHLLFDLGFSHIGTTIFIVLSDTMVILAWLIAYKSGLSIDMQLYVVILLGLVVTVGFYGYVRYIQRKDTPLYHFLQKVGKWTRMANATGFDKFRKFLDTNCDNINTEIHK